MRRLFLLLWFAFSGASAQMAITGTPPVVPSGTIEGGTVNYSTNVILRNVGSAVSSSQMSSLADAEALYVCCGAYPPYTYSIEMLEATSAAEHATLMVAKYVKRPRLGRTVIGNLFPAGENSLFQIDVISPYKIAASLNYLLVFRVYDSACGLTRSAKLKDRSCVIYQLNLNSGTVNWTTSAPPTPPAIPPVYPMINQTVPGGNPPTALPTSTFLNCNHAWGCS